MKKDMHTWQDCTVKSILAYSKNWEGRQIMVWIKRLEQRCMITPLSLVPQTSFSVGWSLRYFLQWMWYWQQVKSRTVVQVFMYWLGVTDATSIYLHQMANHPAIICALTACQTQWVSPLSLYTMNAISPSTTCSWKNFFVVSGKNIPINQIGELNLQIMSKSQSPSTCQSWFCVVFLRLLCWNVFSVTTASRLTSCV